MKKTTNQILTLAQILSQCKVTAIADNKQKFALVRLMTAIQPILEAFDKTQEQARTMFTTDTGNIDTASFNHFLNEELAKEQDITFDGISFTTYEQLCTGNDHLTIGQLSLLSCLVTE